MWWQNGILFLYTAALGVLFIFSAGQAFLIYFYLKAKKKPAPQKPSLPLHLPKITVQLPLFNELYVTERLINAVCQLDYPKELLQIQVLDDSTDQSLAFTKKLVDDKKRLGFNICQLKREKNIGFKAGALQHGLQQATGEFIAIFDADFIPEADFLKQLLPYFRDKKIGMVQSRWGHLNNNYSLLTKVQGFGLDGHFSVEQGGRSARGLFMSFNGTAGLWRKACILDAGAWQHDTLTEDLDLSYRAQLKGWKFKYLEDVVSPAELPATLNALKSQQHRWTKGAIEVSKKTFENLWQADVSKHKKLFGFFHLLNSYAFVFVFLAAVLSIPVLLIKNAVGVPNWYFPLLGIFALAFVIMCAFYIVAFYQSHRSLKNFIVTFLAFVSVSMALSYHNSVAVLEGLFGFKSAFIRTPKFNILKSEKPVKNIYANYAFPLSFYVECALMLYFVFGIVAAYHFKDFALLPFHLFLVSGFGILNFYALKDKMKGKA
ncbi:glycosyltransferase [Pelobium manganitolerans]|uniref:cellulose synthase family protein n=1 Tax=Pelobium manganitolerans TaxID=1842495 RepID=UPI003FA3665F